MYDYQESRGLATIKLIPRLDLSGRVEPEDPSKRKRKIRPAQRFINDEDIKQIIGSDVLDKRRDMFTGEMFAMHLNQRFRDGYVYKSLNVKSLEVHDVVPTLDELQKFQAYTLYIYYSVISG